MSEDAADVLSKGASHRPPADDVRDVDGVVGADGGLVSGITAIGHDQDLLGPHGPPARDVGVQIRGINRPSAASTGNQ